jgi:hypothetical protein
VTIVVPCSKGGRSRIVPVLPGNESWVLACLEGRDDPADRAFVRLPSRLDIHALRRSYAQNSYQLLSGRELPPTEGRLHREQVDHGAVRQVAQALGAQPRLRLPGSVPTLSQRGLGARPVAPDDPSWHGAACPICLLTPVARIGETCRERRRRRPRRGKPFATTVSPGSA